MVAGKMSKMSLDSIRKKPARAREQRGGRGGGSGGRTIVFGAGETPPAVKSTGQKKTYAHIVPQRDRKEMEALTGKDTQTLSSMQTQALTAKELWTGKRHAGTSTHRDIHSRAE